MNGLHFKVVQENLLDLIPIICIESSDFDYLNLLRLFESRPKS